MQIQQRKDSQRLQWKNANNVNGQSQIGRSIWRDKRLKFTSSVFFVDVWTIVKKHFPSSGCHKCVHPAPKCNIENHQSWTIVARNIAIAGINHPLSELLGLLTRRSIRRGHGEVFETIFSSDFQMSLSQDRSLVHFPPQAVINSLQRITSFNLSRWFQVGLGTPFTPQSFPINLKQNLTEFPPTTTFWSSDKSWLVYSLVPKRKSAAARFAILSPNSDSARTDLSHKSPLESRKWTLRKYLDLQMVKLKPGSV